MRNFIRTILSLSFILTFGYSALSQGAPGVHVVTFKVSAANITVGPNGLYLGGGIIGGADAVQLTDPDGNGVYEGTDTLSGAGGGKFIFLNSPAYSTDWNTKEIIQGLPCSDPNNWDDRTLPSFTQDTTLLFCFGTCATDTICPAPWVSTGPLSGVYTINANSFGARNYTSITAAIADLDSLGVIGAVTFNVASGVYDEQINLGEVTGASSVNTITFFGDVGNAFSPIVLTYTPVGSSDNWTVKMTGTDYVTFDNMTITSGGSSYASLIVYTDTVTNFNLTNCHLIGKTSGSTSSNYAGLYYTLPAVAAGNWHISDNTFDSVSYAIYVYGLGYGANQGADSVFIEDNTINANYNGFYVRYAKYQKMHDNVINDINGNSLRNYAYYPVYELDVQNNQVNDASYGIYVYTAPPTSGATGGIKATISNNHFEGTYYGIYLGGSSSATTEKWTDVTIENNSIEAWGSSYNYGIRLNYINASTTARAKVQNNMISLNTTSTTGTLYGIYPYHCANVDIHHNSIAANGGSLTNSRLIYMNASSSTSLFTPGGNSFKNNIVANLNGGMTIVVQSATAAGAPAYFTSENNVFYSSNAASFNYGGTTMSDSVWRATTSQDLNSVWGDPMFTNPLTDLHVMGPGADNAGTPVGLTIDIDGDSRSTTTPDIGADEYTFVPICFAPTGVSTYNISSSYFYFNFNTANSAIEFEARAAQTGTQNYSYYNQTYVGSNGLSQGSISGLSGNTEYFVQVREICAIGDTSAWSNPVIFSTLCNSIAVTPSSPFFENFDGPNWLANPSGYNTGTWDNCWSVEPTQASYPWQINTGGTPSSSTGPLGANSGSNYIYFESSGGGTGSPAVVKTPSFNLSTTSPQLSFAYHMYGSNQDAIYIDVSTNNGISFTTIDSVTSTMANQSDPWAIHYTDLSSYVNNTVMIAFRVIKASSFRQDAAIDDVSVGKAVTCFPASNLTSLNETTDSFEASWTPGNTSAIGYQVRYAINDGNANWSYLYGTGSSVNVVGLAPGTQYEWNVREVCAIGDTAEWSIPVAVNTKFCSPSFECSVTAKLHDSYGDGWNGGEIAIEQKNASGQWTPVEVFGTNFTNNTGTPAGDTILEYGNVCAGDSFRVVGVQPGGYPYEMGWLLTNPEGDTLDYRQGNNSGSSWSPGTVFGTGLANCNLDKCLAIQVAPAPSVPSFTLCGPQNVILADQLPNPDFDLLWMKNQDKNTGPKVVHTGSSYDLGMVSRFKEFLVQYYTKNDTIQGYHVGPSSSLFGGFSNSNNGTWFSVQSPLSIDSITVKSNGFIGFKVNISSALGNITSGNQGELLQESDLITLNSAGTHKVYVGLVILPGEYFMNMDFSHGSTGQLHRAVTGASYPYALGNISIDSVDYSSQNYAAYAYDWVVSEGCMGPFASTGVVVRSEVDTTLSLDGPLDFCAGGSVTMTAASRLSPVVSIDSTFTVMEPPHHSGGYPNTIAKDINTSTTNNVSSIDMDGSINDFMSLGTSGALAVSSSQGRSFLLDIKPDSYGGILLARYVNFNVGLCSFFISINPSGKIVVAGNGTNALTTNNSVALNQWQRLAVTISSTGQAKTYVNGTLEASGNIALNNSIPTQEFMVGCLSSAATTNRYDGTIDNLVVWDGEMTASEVTSYANCIPLSINTDVIGKWSFDEGLGLATADSSGTSSGTLSSVTLWSNDAPSVACSTGPLWGISSNASITDTLVLMNDGSSGMNTDYGYSFPQSLCGCDSTGVVNNPEIQGKVVLISRGTCQFGWKAYLAQLAGASGVVVYNAYNDAAAGGGTFGMLPGYYGSLVTIPATFVANSTGTILKNEIEEASAGYSYLWSTGDTTQSITVNQAGSYFATLTTPYGVCSETTATYTTSILPDPNTGVVASGPLAFCSGDTLTLSGVTLTADSLVGPIPGGNGSAGNMFNIVNTSGAPLTITGFSQGPGSGGSSATGVTVQVYSTPGDYTTQSASSWMPAGTAVTNLTANAATGYCPVTVTIPVGETYGFYVGITSGSVQYTNGTGTAGVSTWFSNNDITVTEGLGGPYPSPTFSPRCWNGTVHYSLNSGNSGQSYLWTNGDTTQTTSITQAGSYYAVVTSADGCVDTTDIYSALVFAAPDTSVSQSGSLDFCSYEDVTLTAAAGQNYLWSTGDTTQSITVNQIGSYSAMIITSDGCSEMTATYTTTVFADADTSVSVSGSLDFCSYDDVTLTAAAGQTYLWSNGATTQSITVNQAGSYSAIVTTTNGCSDTTATYTTTVFADPDTSVSVSGSLDFCSYDDVTLTAAAGQTYLWSNGATTQSITVSQAGVYSAVVTTTNGCSDTTATYTTSVFADADTSVTASGPLDFCSYDDVTLTAAAGQSYAWNTGDTSQAITSTMAGTYSVIVTTSDGCTDTTVDYNTTIFADADTSVVVTQTLFCASDSAILIAAPGQSYLWNNGDTTQASIVNSTGDYFVTATTTNGCAGSSDTTSINVVPDVIVPQIVSNGLGWVGTGSSTSLTITTDSTQTYQWNVDGGMISSGQGTDSLVVTWGIPDTSVTVWLVITNGVCTDSTSIEFVISGIGFEDTDLANAKLYPNPNDGYFTVEVPEQYIGSEMNVIDGIGRVIEHMVIQEVQTNIDLRRRPKGVYRIQIKSKEGIKTIPVVIQ